MPLYSASKMAQISTSKAAEDESPLPESTLEVAVPSKPRTMQPISCMRAAMPRMMEAGVPCSSFTGERLFKSTRMGAKPSLCRVICKSSRGDTAATVSRLTAAASTRPLLWSVWLPHSSVRPGALTSRGIFSVPNRSSCRLSSSM